MVKKVEGTEKRKARDIKSEDKRVGGVDKN